MRLADGSIVNRQVAQILTEKFYYQCNGERLALDVDGGGGGGSTGVADTFKTYFCSVKALSPLRTLYMGCSPPPAKDHAIFLHVLSNSVARVKFNLLQYIRLFYCILHTT